MARSIVCAIVALGALALAQGQRITTIQLDGVQYFVSRMNPYSPELNYFLAYQYCRSLGLQLTSFESKEKSDSITQYLRNAGYNQYDFWTSGNRLGTDMFLWMSTGLPFNATFDLMNVPADEAAAGQPQDAVVMTSEQPAPLLRRHGSARQSKSGPSSGCVSLKAPDLHWAVDDCTSVKDFICEQTRCYYYNYGSIPVSSSQGRNSKDRPVPVTTTTTASPTIASTTLAPTTTTEAILLDHQDHQEHQDQQAETGNEVPAEEAVGDDAADAATAPPAAAEAVEDAVDDSQPDNSVLAGTDAPPQPTDLPAVPSRARGKYLEQPAAPGGPGGPGVPGSAGGWGWPANIKLEIPVPRRVSGSVGGSV